MYFALFASGPTPEPADTQIDTHFLMEMIPHHRAGVAMARVALEKATHRELKDMAENIIDNQNHEIDEMTRWLHDWYGLEPPTGTAMPMSDMQAMMPMTHSGMPDMDMAMQQLESKSGAAFEVAFLSDWHLDQLAGARAGSMEVAGQVPAHQVRRLCCWTISRSRRASEPLRAAARQPAARIKRATRFFPTPVPVARSSAWVGGALYVQ